ncbi:hypothetical protein [Bacillus sp. 491mf]|uniref:hypothetical protein n=1 Tax=Bacillus sp. 491mf TaxID=1761755 RepID=UPI00114D4100|nr:hypothetical protein [Bacillus sp. 491mf]
MRTEKRLQPLQQEILHTLQVYIEVMNENQLRMYQKRVQSRKKSSAICLRYRQKRNHPYPIIS